LEEFTMPSFTLLRRAALSLGAAAMLSACGPLEQISLTAARLVGDSTTPETRRLESPIAPVGKPATPLREGFAYRDLRTGATGRMSVTTLGGDAIRVQQSDGCVWTRWGDWFAPSDSWAACDDSQNWHTGRARVRVEESIWPLRVGAVGRFERDAVSHTGRSYTRTTTCRVRDEVAVVREGHAPTPAFVVDCVDGKRVRTTWYAPDQGPIAFRKRHQDNGVEEAWVRL
jgi:hypothetical protein